MTISEILTTARELAGQSQSAFYTDSKLISYADIVYQENIDYIATSIDGGKFWAETTMDLTEGVTDYIVPQTTTTTIGLKEVKRVEIKVNGDWIKVDERKLTQLQDVPLEYNNFYLVKGSSISLVNTGHKTVTNGLKIYGTTDITKLTTATAESAINLPNDRGYIIALGIVPYIHALDRRFDEEQVAQQRYKTKLGEKLRVAKLKRYQTIYKDNPPDDDIYRK